MPLKSHPFTKGFFCPKLNKRKNLLYHPKRIKTPLIRSGPKGTQTFKEASYNGILNIINQKVNEVKKHFDFNCILAAFYSGNSGLISMYGPLRLFYQIKGTITKGGICNEGGIAGLSEIFGTYSITNPFQISSPETRLIVNWAANVSSNNNHVNFLIKNKIKQNTPLIVIDSRKISIAKYADLFLQPFPNSDHLLAKIVLYKLIKNEILDHKFLEKYVEGYENLINEVLSINPSELIPLIGVKEKEIDQFVGMLSASKSHTIFNIGYGLQKHKYGGRIIQIVSLIQIFLGNIGKPGSGIIYSQSGFNKPIKEPIINYIIQKSKSSSVKEFELINLTSELKKEKYKILFIYNFNPVSSLPNQDDLRKALCQKGLFTVVLDLFLNETTKYADIVIPVKFDLEASDLVFSYYIPGVSIIEGGPCPYENCRSNYDFFRDLAIKMNLNKDGLFNEDHYQLYKNTLKKLPEPIRKKLEEEGYYLLHKNDTILFEDLQFPTLSKKIQLTDITFDFETEIINYLNKR
ncbi:MAG: molybdopterin-dependent oxidoreductase, partial [Candidatus Lokiarchaeota archaeon]